MNTESVFRNNIAVFPDMVAESFPDGDPEPYKPASEVKQFLKEHKSDAPLRARIPPELLDFLKKWADVSDKKLSPLVCRLLLERVMVPWDRCPRCGKRAVKSRGGEETRVA